MPVQLANPKERALQTLLAKDKVRLRNPQTGELLHLSGQGTTTDVTWSWLGYNHQAETLRSRATTRGEDWPFAPVPRNLLDPAREVEDV
ncbi:hypothetical protein ETW23_05795 [Leisingera sp. NJS201]|uniref:hypothetical protein n=1 Tax=Leisingera sp. NJS201 TaxID=2508306 RepID=UPI001070DA80|nr:hypothetical protein [Leisingera sp. NJS201]QBR35724.1 hypothetical protein ETW23_05795 [Leisingera sp. NJS201]